MKREDVKNKIPGITEEQLNWLMQENGSDIIREKFLSTLSLRRATACSKYAKYGWVFLSTLSLRRATNTGLVVMVPLTISIHALLAESDLRGCPVWSPRRYFYPRSPCGERLPGFKGGLRNRNISIHALLAESDAKCRNRETDLLFLSTLSPCGERL